MTAASVRFLWSATILGALCPLHQALAATGPEVIERMQSRFAEARTYEARFEKEFYWAALDRRMSREGRIYTRRPGQFRVEVQDGDLVVADGQRIWAYSKANEQVVVSQYAGELRTPWEVLVEYASAYRPVAVEETQLDGRRAYQVTLQPLEDVPAAARLQRMRVWVEAKGWDLLRVEQVEANDDMRTYTLRDHRTNRNLTDDLFRFTPPEGTEVIDRSAPDADP